MKIKQWQKNILSMGLLLSFFFLGGLSTARAECDPNNITVSGTKTAINGNYSIFDEELNIYHRIEGTYQFRTFLNDITSIIFINDPNDNEGVGIRYFNSRQNAPYTLPYTFINTGEDTITVSQTTCGGTPPEENDLVGGYFFKTPPASSLGAGVGTISTDVMGSLLPYIFVCGGLLIGFWLVEKILALIPKDNTMEKADKEIARSEKVRKETKRIIATLD
jgi:hypothetical protein